MAKPIVIIDDRSTIRISNLAISLTRSGELLETLAQLQKFRILKRTAAGTDITDRAFRPYSLSYKEIRAAAGRPTNKVDLNFTGRMLNSLSTKAESGKAYLFFGSPIEAAKAKRLNAGEAETRLPKREFFGVSAADVKALQKEVRDWGEETLSA